MRLFVILLIVATTAVLIFWTNSGDNLDLPAPLPPAPSEAIYTNGKIYTGDPLNPWANALLVRENRLVLVGENAEVQALASPSTEQFDLENRFVMAGIVDAHTHPGLVAILSDDEETSRDPMPSKPLASILSWLQEYADANPFSLSVIQGYWDVAEFLPEGPHRSDLDSIYSLKPVMLFDNSGHSVWVNTALLNLIGVDETTPDLSEVSYFVKDDAGQLTGWVKEFALFPYIAEFMVPEREVLLRRFLEQVNYLSSHGITSLWDAGNFNMDNPVYDVAAELDKAGLLPIRYEASYHVWDPNQIDNALNELLELRRKYAGTNLKFNSIKIHFDGVHEVLTAAMLEPYATDPENYGGALFDRDRLTKFILELDAADVDLHLHVVGDRATRIGLDSVERAVSEKGEALQIEYTLSHLEYVDPSDIPRFKSLNVHANFTPHWFGGTIFGDAGKINLGPERASQSQVVGAFLNAGANVTLSSDVVSGDEAHRANPFIGIEMSMTRKEYGAGDDAPVLSPGSASISLESALAAYTLNGARQLGQESEIGSLIEGKYADFIVLDKDPFNTDTQDIHSIVPVATIVGGQLVSGSIRQLD